MFKKYKKFFIALILLLVFFSVFALFAAISAKKAIETSSKAIGAIKLQDLDATKAYLNDSKKEFETTQKYLLVLTPLRIIPLFGWYISDAQRGVNAAVHGVSAVQTLVLAIEPYADVLGLEGEGDFLGGTAQERLAKAIETLAKVSPQIDEVAIDLGEAKKSVNKIASWRYPNFLPGQPAKQLDNAKQSLNTIDNLIVDAKPLLDVLPKIMGQTGEQKYLILFQNDKELRPTGGFITAYAVFRVENGVITSEGSNDIYQLDSTLTKKFPAPEPILKYLDGVSNLTLRDSNLSPDYKSSMNQFQELYSYSTEAKKIDGIIALDTQFVVDMIKVLGPLEAYGEKFTNDEQEECACPHIIYQLELFADQPVAYDRGDRKGIIGVLMQDMMSKTFEAPKSTWPKIVGQLITSLQRKDIIMYFNDPITQEAIEKINFGGRLYQYNGDYLHINESNFGGAKSNLYVEQKVRQTLKKDQKKIIKKVEIDYKYPRRMDNCSLERVSGLCLAGIYRSWIRIYVPLGSTLLSSKGLEVALETTEDLGKTVFEGFFTLRPEGTAKIELEYELPQLNSDEYKLLIQKQPGTHNNIYEIDAFGKKLKGFPLDTDKEIIVRF